MSSAIALHVCCGPCASACVPRLVADGREGINGLTISNAIHLSGWLGKTVTLPFDEDLFLSELEKRKAEETAANT